MAALWYHYFLPLLVNSAVLDAHFFYSNAVFGWDVLLSLLCKLRYTGLLATYSFDWKAATQQSSIQKSSELCVQKLHWPTLELRLICNNA